MFNFPCYRAFSLLRTDHEQTALFVALVRDTYVRGEREPRTRTANMNRERGENNVYENLGQDERL